MAKFTLDEHERVTLTLYQEKIAYWRNLCAQHLDNAMKVRGLNSEDCIVDLMTGRIKLKKVNKR